MKRQTVKRRFSDRVTWGYCLITILLCLANTDAISQALTSDQGANNLEKIQLRHIEEQLSKVNKLSGTFTQSKRLHNFPFPLESSGDFLIDDEENLTWNIRHPIESSIQVTEQGMVLTQQNFQKNRHAVHPGINQVTQIIRAVLAMNWNVLKQHFSIQIHKPVPHWHITLTPIDGILATSIMHIELVGSNTLEQVVIDEASEDSTTIRFDIDRLSR